MPNRTTKEQLAAILASKSEEELQRLNAEDFETAREDYETFKRAYAEGKCYLCDKSFKSVGGSAACLHWLLREGKFKKKAFPQVFEAYDYHRLASYLRWVANQERYMSSINDLKSEADPSKFFSYTIKWKHIEWSFSCSRTDLEGHGGPGSNFPHYHFQMRISGQQFINYNDFHVPFSEEDLFIFDMQREHPDRFRHSFGPGGAGMQDAMDLGPEVALEHSLSTSDEERATFRIQTIVMAEPGKSISGEILQRIFEEHKKTGRTMGAIARDVLGNEAGVTSIVSPADTIPDIAERTKREGR